METNQKTNELPADVVCRLVEAAVKAPSGHNSQPWLFGVRENTVFIRPDFRHALPVVDKENRELYVSIGCATENLCIAAANAGYMPLVEYGDPVAVTLRKQPERVPHPLYPVLFKRQCNRQLYNGERVPDEILCSVVRRSGVPAGVHLSVFPNGSPGFARWASYIAEGNGCQMNDLLFKEELISSMRFNRKEIRNDPAGLTYHVIGAPALPRFMAKRIVRSFLTPAGQKRTDSKKLRSSSHLVLFSLEKNDLPAWIEAGRVLERFLLYAASEGIAVAFMNQPCEVAAIATRIQASLSAYPVLVLRIGYASPAPYSPRRKPVIGD